jgi:cobalt-zinc-cadmium efflux system membrane fusion protein
MKRAIAISFFAVLLGTSVATWMFPEQIPLALRSYLPHASDGMSVPAVADEHGMGDGEAHGPHGGRLLVARAFAVEITIAEMGHPPEFRVYAYAAAEPVAPELVNLNIELARLDGTVDRFAFAPIGDYLRGAGVVSEPHSFDVTVAADYLGQAYNWSYENHEGRVHIAQAQARQAEVATEVAGPTTIHETLALTGRVQTDPNRMSRVLARFPGVELDVFGRDLPNVQAGQSVAVETFDGYRVQGKIDWISPLAAHASQSVRARIPLPNPDGRLRPGQFVRGRVTIAEHDVPLAVRKSAVQRFRDFQVVFARFGETYEVRMLDLGRGDNEWVEVLGGLAPGTDYVTSNSYLIKADIDKSGASHDH